MRRNYPLWIGLFLTAGFLLLAIFGPYFAPLDPLERFSSVIKDANGNTYIPSVTPLPPFTLELFPLGTDNAGRDIFSRLLWAIRPTMITCFAVVLMRMAISIPLGLSAGWLHGTWYERIIDGIIALIIAIPALLLAIALIALSETRPLSIFILVLAVIGWADMTLYIKNQTKIIKQAEYVTSARSIGAGTGSILRRHVFPQLWPAFPALLAFELSAVLLLMAELGFLGFFIGNGHVVFAADPNSAGVIAVGLTSGMPELGQMLSDFWSKIFKSPWEMVMAATAIFLMVFAFNMLGEGLRRRMDVTSK